jgi:hypothetical protein
MTANDPLELNPEDRLPRPVLVELAAAILIVSGVLGTLGVVGGAGALPEGTGLLVAATIALNVASITIGILIRTGRLWIVDINYVAVLGFLDLTAAGASPLALLLGIADVSVVLILLVHRPWLVERAAARRQRASAGRERGGGSSDDSSERTAGEGRPG